MRRTTAVAAIMACQVLVPEGRLMAQTEPNDAIRWLSGAELAPEFNVPARLKDWEKTRKEVRATLWQLLGKHPARPARPEAQLLSREERDGYVVEKFQFDNRAGSAVPGYLLLPAGAQGKLPAILYCHWHGGQYDIGKQELFQTNATPVPAGPTLAKLGYAVIAVDACCFGERNGRGPGGPTEKGGSGEMTASKFNLWAGRSLWGMILRDDLMALDYLCTRPEVDAERIGVTGISMGATRTWWLMGLDERLKAGVAVACLTRYQDLIATQGLQYHGIYYFVPGMLLHFDTEAVVALSAPRPLLCQAGDQDWGSPVTGIVTIENAVKQAYRLYQKEGNFQSVIYPNLGHVYTPEMWERTVAWFATNLARPRNTAPAVAR
jgi:dienelactone hydrolase